MYLEYIYFLRIVQSIIFISAWIFAGFIGFAVGKSDNIFIGIIAFLIASIAFSAIIYLVTEGPIVAIDLLNRIENSTRSIADKLDKY